MELLKLATTNQLFQLDGILYEQVEGVAMGSPLGPLVGDFRFEYEYEIEYENDFSILVFRLHIITTHPHLIL